MYRAFVLFCRRKENILMGLIYIVSAIYSIFLMRMYFAWKKIPQQKNLHARYDQSKKISVVICARNEERGLPLLLEDLNNQSLLPERYEVIVVDDHSTDNTVAFVKAMQLDVKYDLKLVSLNVEIGFQNSFKKRAITEAIAIAQGDIIITTDGDCRVKKGWLESFYTCFAENKVVMISGPVTFHNEKTWFEKSQTIEFAALIGIGASSIQIGSPSMCNGANLAYLKKTFYEVQGFDGVEHIHSGDDELLMHKVHEKHPGKILFLKSKEAIVYTEAKVKLTEFVQQRKRWASKWKHYKDVRVSALAIFIFLYHFSFILGLFGAMLGLMSFISLFLVFLLKLSFEFIFLNGVLTFLGKRFFVLNFLSLGVLYSFYVLYFGLAVQKGNYTWKERKLTATHN